MVLGVSELLVWRCSVSVVEPLDVRFLNRVQSPQTMMGNVTHERRDEHRSRAFS